jgi:hypothetical protein
MGLIGRIQGPPVEAGRSEPSFFKRAALTGAMSNAAKPVTAEQALFDYLKGRV